MFKLNKYTGVLLFVFALFCFHTFYEFFELLFDLTEFGFSFLEFLFQFMEFLFSMPGLIIMTGLGLYYYFNIKAKKD